MAKKDKIDASSAAEKKSPQKARSTEQLSDGFKHEFVPLRPMDLSKVSSFSDLLGQMRCTSFGGRAIGKACDIMYKMFSDQDCVVVATISGAVTIGKQGPVIADLIEQGCINIIVSTGAIICHGLIEELGGVHFEHDKSWSDESLYRAGYNRIYDTIEPEKNIDRAEQLVFSAISSREGSQPFCSSELCRLIGGKLAEQATNKGIVRTAYENDVPIFIPAFTDSELGLALEIYNAKSGGEKVRFDPLLDLHAYSDMVSKAKYLGILTIGGGVPRNWAQQVGPFVDALQRRGIHDIEKPVMFRYGVRICPEPVHWGGLSGCTYSEGVSWGKFVSPQQGGEYAEVLCDATIALPILTVAVFERLGVRE